MALDILSTSEVRPFKQYSLEGINTIGVFGDETYAIRYTNRSHQRVQVKLSIDGADILTGKQANLGNTPRLGRHQAGYARFQ